MTFGRKLKGLIEERNITQKELAQQLNIAPSTISSYVQNTREPDHETLRKIVDYFEVSFDYLLSDCDQKEDDFLQQELLRVFHAMSEPQKELFVEQGKAIVRIQKKYQA